VPGPQHRADPLRVGEAHRLECRQRVGIVLDAGEHQAARRGGAGDGGEFGCGLEQCRVVPFDARQMRHQRVRERFEGYETLEGGQTLQRGRVLRQPMCLPVGHHLQAVLERAEKIVGVGEIDRRAPVQLARPGQRRQCAERRRVAQRRVAPAPDELQDLRGELDLTDAAPAELHVVAGDGDPGAALLRMDLPLDRMDVSQRRIVEMPTPDERADLAQEGVAERAIPGDRPRLDHRRAFPVLPERFVVAGGGGDAYRERRRRRVGTQA